MITTKNLPVSLADLYPGIAHIGLGTLTTVRALIGPPLHVDSTTYKQAHFIAPCDGCRIVDAWIAATVKNSAATNTLACENYDASANAARAVFTTFDPDTITTALEGQQITLSTTKANLDMDKGDVLWTTLVVGTPCTNGEGHTITFTIWVPYVAV